MRTDHRDILRLALPSIVSNITVPLLSMVDTVIVGHMGDAVFIAAIALGGTAFSVAYWIFAFLRMSTSGLVAQAHGARDMGRAVDVLVKSMLTAGGLSAIILVLQQPLFRLAVQLTSARAEAMPVFSAYFFTCIWGAPAILLGYSLSGWFIGRQDTRTPMLAAILQNVVNILASTLLVFVFHLGIRGVALGTVIGAWSGLLFMFCRLRGTPWGDRDPQGIGWSQLFLINRDIFLRTLCLVAVTVYFTRAGSLQSAGILEANALLMQLSLLFSYFIDGFANAGEALSGRYYGARDMEGLRRIIVALFWWGGAVALCFSVLYLVGGDLLMSLFTNQPAVRQTAHDYLPWIWVAPLVSFWAYMWDGIFIGLTRSRQMFQSMVVAMAFFFVAWLALRHSLSNHALWFAFDGYLLMRGFVQWLLFRRDSALFNKTAL